MKEEQERPKIKLKVRQIEEDSPSSFGGNENTLQKEPGQIDEKQPTQKIIIHQPTEAEENEKTSKKRTIFQICAIILTVLLAIAIVVEIFVMVWLKINTEDLKNKNNKLPPEETTISTQI